jgi:hypothetical protein
MKKIFVCLFLGTAFILGLSAVVPIRGSWLDRGLSRWLHHKLSADIRLGQVQFKHWNTVSFESLKAISKNGTQCLSSGRGRLSWKGLPWSKNSKSEADLYLIHLMISPEMYKKIPVAAISLSKFIDSPALIEKISIHVRQEKQNRMVRITEYLSQDFTLRGGWKFEHNKLTKAHLLILLPNNGLEKLPRQLRTRLLSRGENGKGARLVFQKNTITVFGRTGPLMRAQWNS